MTISLIPTGKRGEATERAIVKTFFQKYDYPTEEQFSDLIDSTLNLKDDAELLTVLPYSEDRIYEENDIAQIAGKLCICIKNTSGEIDMTRWVSYPCSAYRFPFSKFDNSEEVSEGDYKIYKHLVFKSMINQVHPETPEPYETTRYWKWIDSYCFGQIQEWKTGLYLHNDIVIKKGKLYYYDLLGSPLMPYWESENFEEDLRNQVLREVGGGQIRKNTVIDLVDPTQPPPTTNLGDRYILDYTEGVINANWGTAVNKGDIVTLIYKNPNIWIGDTPVEGWTAYSDSKNLDLIFVDDDYPEWIERSNGEPAASTDYKTLGKLIGADLNSTDDQIISISAAKYIISKVIFANCSVDISSGATEGGIYTEAGKGGTDIVPANSTYQMSTPNSTKQIYDVSGLNTVVQYLSFNQSALFFSLTTAFGSEATCDIYIFGHILD